MYIIQTCTNVPKWGWIDVGVRDNVGTRWGHLAPEKRTQREGQLRGEVLVRGTISFSIDPKFSLKKITNHQTKMMFSHFLVLHTEV